MNSTVQQRIDEACALWRKAHCVLTVTGAGISVPSGIPDFRSPGGLWTKFDPDEVASLTALKSRPRRVWEFLLEAARVFGRAEPNAAHLALAELERAGFLAGVITQNIDGLHQRAGSAHVIEFHGSAAEYHCMRCGRDHPRQAAERLREDELPWLCECGGVIRPDIVFFGEMIPPHALSASRELASQADLCVIVGTSGEVAPANTLAHAVAASGGRVVEINLGATAYGSLADVRIDARCEEVLPAIRNALVS
ncbi:MAG: NAD-dependent deacylase [Desulfovibrionaceae bacterium]|jgi:NAD-dependent deacetylase|nr:NAD-dependent deacylase [Desulfovibrionaceae bacterium]